MQSEHLIGTTIPRFTYDTPLTPGQDFYALCAGETPLVMIFLPGFDHPISREYLTRYLKSLRSLKDGRLACVVRTKPQEVAAALEGRPFPFPLICDPQGVLYNFLGVEHANILQTWTFAAQRIFRSAKGQGFVYDRSAPQQLPLTLVLGPEGHILFAHYGRSLTDLPEDCVTISEICRSVTHLAQTGEKDPDHCSDETLTLPDLSGELEQEEPDALGALFH